MSYACLVYLLDGETSANLIPDFFWEHVRSLPDGTNGSSDRNFILVFTYLMNYDHRNGISKNGRIDIKA